MCQLCMHISVTCVKYICIFQLYVSIIYAYINYMCQVSIVYVNHTNISIIYINYIFQLYERCSTARIVCVCVCVCVCIDHTYID